MKYQLLALAAFCCITNGIQAEVDSDTLKLRKNIPSTISSMISLACKGETTDGMSLTYRNLTLDELNALYKAKKPITEKDLAEHRINNVISLEPHDIPAYKNYELFTRDSEGKVTPLLRFTAEQPDTLVATNDGNRLDLKDYHIFTNDFLPGEATYYILMSTDGQHYCAAEIIPYPIETKNSFGYSIKGKLIDRQKKSFAFEASGFDPDEKVSVKTLSEKEQNIAKAQADKDGKVVFNTLPSRKGVSGGEGLVAVTGRKGAVTLRYKWGAAAY